MATPQDMYPTLVGTPNRREHLVRFVGGSAAVTKVAGTGQNITVAYVSTGIVTLTWGANPGLFLGASGGFQATTASGVKGYTMVPGVFNTTTYTLTLNITNASDALADLAALQWLTVYVDFADPST